MKNVKTLIADDEDHIRLFVKTLLMGMGCDVVAEARNGQEAIALFEQHHPDLVLLDINMPILDGRAALRALRAQSDDVTIIMLSSLAGADVVEDCLDAGADYLLRKDLPLEDLRREIAQIWQSREEG
ncbi:hypothetical protein Pres01_25010 [Metapseudomonas resinovorans]|uniref:response regulator n=1 Tax=Pseudomonadaceae TaxID=135621 RepID=UPI000987C536|nr:MULTISPECIES: response regulator transcription factor [Pseudomonas]MDH4564007.1 response regulator [Pseudomonas sp. BN411]GLZ86450.1 hypothetical protein Pres01_25010 [Pseudomonas resinovorans]